METSTPPVAEPAVDESPATSLSRKGIRRFSAVELLVVLVLWLVSGPFIMRLDLGPMIEAVIMTLVMLSAVVAIGGRRRTLILAVVLAAPACVCKWVNHVRPDLMPAEIHAMAGMVFMLFVVVHLLRFILRAPRVSTEVLCAGISGYLLMGILWAFAYILVARSVPESFVFSGRTDRTMAGVEAVYFSFVTLCTVGYGDIFPASGAARMLAILEAMAGTFYVTVLIARLVTMHSAVKRPDEAG
jgi:hypothetical protein